MGTIKKRSFTAVLMLLVMFVATACFQQVGDEAQGPAVSLVITDTNTPVPPADTNTPIPTADAEDVPISNIPTDTPTATATDTPTTTATPLVIAQAGSEGQGLQPTETDDDFELRATQLIEQATLDAVLPTTQAAATLLGQTDTPTPMAVATLSLGAGGGDTTGIQLTGTDCIHEVRAGETMYRLSLYYGIPVNTIATRNGVVNPNIISIGQKFIITGCGTTGALPPPTSVPSLTPTPITLGIAGGTGGTDLGGTLGQGGGATTTTTTGSVGCQSQYTVQQYDTLFQISVQFGVPVQSIANINGLTNVNRIDMGEVLCIPAS